MKLQKAKLILLSAFEHEPETRAEYFKIEAEKSGYNAEIFFRLLLKAYNQIFKYVNSKDYSYTCIDDNGKEYHDLNIIPIDNFTDGRVLDNENITDLLKPLCDFGALFVQEPETPAPPPQGETTKQKIERILEPLRKAFEDTGKIDPETGIKTPGHIDKIIEALAEYAEGITPDCVKNDSNYCMFSRFDTIKLYKPFKGLNNKIGLNNTQIAEVLRCFIYKGNGKPEKLSLKSIEKNIIGRKYIKAI